MAKHRKGNWTVSQPGSRSVSYPSRQRARRTARQLSGARVQRNSCLMTLALLPFYIMWAAARALFGGPSRTVRRG